MYDDKMTKHALPLNQQFCFAIYSLNSAMGRLYRPVLAEFGLTYPQYLVLLALWERDGQTVGELGKVLFLETNTLTPLLKRMEVAGLVQRRRSPQDERRVAVTLTEKGKRLEDRAHDIGLCVTRAVDRGDTDIGALRDQIADLTERLRAAVSSS
ncbi:MarR family winged helix-turn-helix transcriptional regulator [Leisingera sp. XS_AS12]|uniref:MarR family winged helix-turn-helix transcriptional regulator n=1 Tax=Leisingera sp. XS_AS12 TaxID=3241294 RepID=UPI003515F227